MLLLCTTCKSAPRILNYPLLVLISTQISRRSLHLRRRRSNPLRPRKLNRAFRLRYSLQIKRLDPQHRRRRRLKGQACGSTRRARCPPIRLYFHQGNLDQDRTFQLRSPRQGRCLSSLFWLFHQIQRVFQDHRNCDPHHGRQSSHCRGLRMLLHHVRRYRLLLHRCVWLLRVQRLGLHHSVPERGCQLQPLLHRSPGSDKDMPCSGPGYDHSP